MRLTNKEITIIQKHLHDIFGKNKIYLFGSRVDERVSGGDIDLFLIPEDRRDLFAKKIKALARLKSTLHKPVDIVVHRNFDRRIEQEALKNGVELASLTIR